MTSGFQHQEPLANRALTRTEPRPQQVGVKLPPEEKIGEHTAPPRPPEPRSF